MVEIGSVPRTTLDLSRFDPLVRDLVQKGIQDGSITPEQIKEYEVYAKDILEKSDTKSTVDMKSQPTLGSGTQTAPPQAEYSQAPKKFYVPVENGKVTLNGKEINVKNIFDNAKEADPTTSRGKKIIAKAEDIKKKYDIKESSDGTLLVGKTVEDPAVVKEYTGATNNSVGKSIVSSLQTNSWMMPMMGFMTGGIPGLVMGLIGAKALKASSSAMTDGSSSLAPGLVQSGDKNFGTGYGGLGSLANMVLGSGKAAAAFSDGAAYQMKKQLTSYAQEMKQDSLIAMCNNPGIPIEDLIAMFMAQMADTYEGKLRNKMEETARAEKREQARTREKEAADYKAGMVSGITSAAGAIPGIGTAIAAGGQVAAKTMSAAADAKIAMTDALQGNTKSSTILMQEIQMLMNKWKQVSELLSNLAKSMHDMAMTPIRNLR